MSDLVSAAQRLRDSVAALPEDVRDCEWASGERHVYTFRPERREDEWVAEGRAEEVAEHIATTASPPTVTLLADLLEEVESADNNADEYNWRRAIDDICAAADALASAILHTDQHDGEGK